MFRLWGKLWRSNRLLKDTVICLDIDDTRTHKIFQALEDICQQWDLEKPIWLDANIREFRRSSRTRFTRDCFIENVDFDYLEIQILDDIGKRRRISAEWNYGASGYGGWTGQVVRGAGPGAGKGGGRRGHHFLRDLKGA